MSEWNQYARALVVAVDAGTGTVRRCVEYETPPDSRASDEASIVFKAATLTRDRLHTCTQTELVTYELPSFRRVGYVSLPCFNDLHHVTPTASDTFMVAVTGLDMVIEVTPDGGVVREWATDDVPLWSRFRREVDYRKVLTTKPHLVHPNYVFEYGGLWWVTRCDRRDVRRLDDGHIESVGTVGIHDGHVEDHGVWFTQVNGHLVEVDLAGGTVRRSVDLNVLAGDGPPIGWCRALQVLGDDLVLVGFSRLRPTKWKETVRWVKHGLGGSGYGLRQTRISAYDLGAGRVVWEANLESAGMSAVFSIHAPDRRAVLEAIRRRG